MDLDISVLSKRLYEIWSSSPFWNPDPWELLPIEEQAAWRRVAKVVIRGKV